METEEDTKQLGIKGVYQLQGGIDKYFKQYPEGVLWKGKNYVFDKRFSHAPPAVEAVDQAIKKLGEDVVDVSKPENKVKGQSSKFAAVPVSQREKFWANVRHVLNLEICTEENAGVRPVVSHPWFVPL